MKYASDRESADSEKAARKLLEIANTVEAIQDGRIHIEIELAITRGWLWLHESGTYVKFTQTGADLFA